VSWTGEEFLLLNGGIKLCSANPRFSDRDRVTVVNVPNFGRVRLNPFWLDRLINRTSQFQALSRKKKVCSTEIGLKKIKMRVLAHKKKEM
jgi:hypothetical protein